MVVAWCLGCHSRSSPVASGDRKDPVKQSPPTDALALPEADRVYLWETEHHGTVLSKFGFSALAQAVQKGDPEQLSAVLMPEFLAWIPSQVTYVERHTDQWQARRSEPLQHDQSDAGGFVQWVLQQRAIFASSPSVNISLMHLAPHQRDQLAGDWQGDCRLTVAGTTTAGGPAELTLYLTIELLQPLESTLQSGPWLKSCRVDRIKLARSNDHLLRDVTFPWGIDASLLHDNWTADPDAMQPNPGGVYVCDYNRDAVPDLLITDTTVFHGFVVYEGRAQGKFVDVTHDLGLSRSTVSFVGFADLDGDGWEDLVLGPHAVYRNLEGRRFEDVSGSSNLAQLCPVVVRGGVSSMTVADYDLDGRLDIYVSRSSSKLTEGSWVDGRIGDNYQNQLLRNLGDWKFADVTEETGTDGGRRSTFASLWLHIDDDRYPDLYVINEFGNGVLLVNQRGQQFEARDIVDGPADFGSMGVNCGDIDNDGRVDIYVASMYSKSGNRVIDNLRPDAYDPLMMKKLKRMVAGSQLYRNRGDYQFQRVGEPYDVAGIGWAYGAAMTDLDNDGWLDIYATAGFISRDRSKPDG